MESTEVLRRLGVHVFPKELFVRSFSHPLRLSRATKLLGWQPPAVSSVCSSCLQCRVSVFFHRTISWNKLRRRKKNAVSQHHVMVFNLCLTAPRGSVRENHRRLGGAALLHQAPGLPPLPQLPLLRRHPHPPAVGGVCCPLLETVSGCTRAVTWPWEAWLGSVFGFVVFVLSLGTCFFNWHPPPSPSSSLCRSHMIQVVLGEHSIVKAEGFEQRFNVSLVIRHYQYRHWSFDNDIMLIKVMDGGDTLVLWIFFFFLSLTLSWQL